MQKWILPTISEIIATSALSGSGCDRASEQSATLNSNSFALRRIKVEREWRGAIAAIEQLLLESVATPRIATEGYIDDKGLVLAGPVPILSQETLLSSFQTGIFTTEWLKLTGGKPFQLLPATAKSSSDPIAAEIEPPGGTVIPLLPGDPLVTEQFCLVLTERMSVVMVAGVDSDGSPAFKFAFEPEVVQQAWQSLRSRVALTSPHYLLSQLDAIVAKYPPVAPDYRTVTQFSRLLLKYLPEPLVEGQGSRGGSGSPSPKGLGMEGREEQRGREEFFIQNPKSKLQNSLLPTPQTHPDLELLQAFAHEVRTPLTTIRTLIRLLLKRRDLSSDVQKRLEAIEQECREQIDRMELMFKAAELETSASTGNNTYLIATSLEELLQQSIPRWQQSAKRRNMTLDVILPQQMPTVISHPSMLDRVLTGLLENFTRSLPAGSHIQVQVIPAGDQLKLQLFSQSHLEEDEDTQIPVTPIRKSLGQLLTFQPETGCISLNLNATKHLFQSIGGKLIVRQRPQQGEVLTVFLPLFGTQE